MLNDVLIKNALRELSADNLNRETLDDAFDLVHPYCIGPLFQAGWYVDASISMSYLESTGGCPAYAKQHLNDWIDYYHAEIKDNFGIDFDHKIQEHIEYYQMLQEQESFLAYTVGVDTNKMQAFARCEIVSHCGRSKKLVEFTRDIGDGIDEGNLTKLLKKLVSKF